MFQWTYNVLKSNLILKIRFREHQIDLNLEFIENLSLEVIARNPDISSKPSTLEFLNFENNNPLQEIEEVGKTTQGMVSTASYCEDNSSQNPDLGLENEHSHDLEDVHSHDFTQNQHHSENRSKLESAELFGRTYERRKNHRDPETVPPLVCQESEPRSDESLGEKPISDLDISIDLRKGKC